MPISSNQPPAQQVQPRYNRAALESYTNGHGPVEPLPINTANKLPAAFKGLGDEFRSIDANFRKDLQGHASRALAAQGDVGSTIYKRQGDARKYAELAVTSQTQMAIRTQMLAERVASQKEQVKSQFVSNFSTSQLAEARQMLREIAMSSGNESEVLSVIRTSPLLVAAAAQAQCPSLYGCMSEKARERALGVVNVSIPGLKELGDFEASLTTFSNTALSTASTLNGQFYDKNMADQFDKSQEAIQKLRPVNAY